MPGIPPLRKGEKLVPPTAPSGPSGVSRPPAIIMHVCMHRDIEDHARSFNEGYETAMAQHLADDPAAADDWLNAKLAEAWDEGFNSGQGSMYGKGYIKPNPTNPYRTH